ncbi:M2 family metallopeptidase [Teredinibacter purpureus]|uniref:M2 family metallopeptidase n=1 Tax=Teredinibacter purpureus TaxID=2731756 RepID=UPI0009E5CAAD|nr:M2 family metallopeptidase [Teredinibacter purpureus]
MNRLYSILIMGLVYCSVAACEFRSNSLASTNTVYNEESARVFLAEAEDAIADASVFYSHAAWLSATYINMDSQHVEARAFKDFTLKTVKYAMQVKHWDNVTLDPVTRRKLNVLRAGLDFPSPNDEMLATELSEIAAKMQALYGEGKYCRETGECFNLIEMSQFLAKSDDPKLMQEMWEGWRTISPPMRSLYERQVEIANQGAQDLGFENLSVMWRSNYDMPADIFSQYVDTQWNMVKPLYDALHCHVRAELNKTYGDEIVSKTGKIPAHLLGNMWAQSWGNIYNKIKPAGETSSVDITSLIEEKGMTELDMVETGEAFFSSLGFESLPTSFWERSLFVKPRDREVVCHASAWNLDDKDDLRIKMCIQKDSEDFQTIHHELGHNYYQRAYNHQPLLFKGSANDGFHEALGDTIALSITPSYLVSIGMLDKEPPAHEDLGFLLNQALDKVAFLPFGLLVDKWRWQVFNGELSPENYNEGWWALREHYQGIEAPVHRNENNFDPGAKYHIPGNTPYSRYFLSYIQQFQFHRALCETAEYEGPLHRCSIYGNKAAGKKLKAMMEMGRSRPWQDAMFALTGQREMDASAIVDYFAPVKTWLDKQNEGRVCGW